jgi:hypothetical protein
MSNKTTKTKTKTKTMTPKQREQAELAGRIEVERNYTEAGNAFLAKVGGRENIYLGVVKFLDSLLKSRAGGECVTGSDAWALLRGCTVRNRTARPAMRFDHNWLFALEIDIPIFGMVDPNAVLTFRGEFVWKVANPFGKKKQGVKAVGLKWTVNTSTCEYIPMRFPTENRDGFELKRNIAKATALREEFNAVVVEIKKHLETVTVNA